MEASRSLKSPDHENPTSRKTLRRKTWVALKEHKASYCTTETVFFTTYPEYGKLNYIPFQQPRTSLLKFTLVKDSPLQLALNPKPQTLNTAPTQYQSTKCGIIRGSI